MNKKQRMVIAIAVLLVILSGLFPPYEGEYRLEGDNNKKFMGYRFLFDPPSQTEVCQSILGKTFSSSSGYYLRKFSSTIITSRVWVQIITVVVASTGIVLLLSDRKQQVSPGNSNSTHKNE